MQGKRLNQETYLQRCKDTHGDRYDYSKVVFTKMSEKVTIICKEHGEFQQVARWHSTGGNCPECAIENVRVANSKTWEQMKESFIKAHGNRYDYSKVDYINNNTKVTIICEKHGEFRQLPRTHIGGRGCPKCGWEIFAGKMSKTKEELIDAFRKVHGDRYIYDKTENHGCNNLTIITCRVHGDFKQRVGVHNNGGNCPECVQTRRRRRPSHHVDEVIDMFKKVHGDLYDYSKVRYKNLGTRVKIVCLKHGEFEQTPTIHLSGCGCPKCATSRLATKVRVLLEQLDVCHDMEKQFEGCKDRGLLRFDFYLPDHNIVIECQGQQHYFPVDIFGGKNQFRTQCRRDQIKRDFCEKEGIPLVEVPYWFTDEEIEQIILDNLKFL